MPLKTHMDEQPSLNLTPMIDVTFLIVIFFLVGTQFVEDESEIDIKVPQVAQAGSPLTAAPQRRIVNIAQDGTVTLDLQVVSLADLTSQLATARSEYPELSVVVRGDAHGEFQNVANALNAVQQAGIADMGIAVRQLEQD